MVPFSRFGGPLVLLVEGVLGRQPPSEQMRGETDDEAKGREKGKMANQDKNREGGESPVV